MDAVVPKNDTRRTELLKAIKTAVQEHEGHIEERHEINEALGEIRARMAALGIPKKSLAAAIQYMRMDPKQRQGFDIAYRTVREAIELPVDAQTDIIDFLAEKEKAAEREKAAAESGASAKEKTAQPTEGGSATQH